MSSGGTEAASGSSESIYGALVAEVLVGRAAPDTGGVADGVADVGDVGAVEDRSPLSRDRVAFGLARAYTNRREDRPSTRTPERMMRPLRAALDSAATIRLRRSAARLTLAAVLLLTSLAPAKATAADSVVEHENGDDVLASHHDGTFEGTASLIFRRADGISFVLLFKRNVSTNLWGGADAEGGQLNDLANQVTTWPSGDRFRDYGIPSL